MPGASAAVPLDLPARIGAEELRHLLSDALPRLKGVVPDMEDCERLATKLPSPKPAATERRLVKSAEKLVALRNALPELAAYWGEVFPDDVEEGALVDWPPAKEWFTGTQIQRFLQQLNDTLKNAEPLFLIRDKSPADSWNMAAMACLFVLRDAHHMVKAQKVIGFAPNGPAADFVHACLVRLGWSPKSNGGVAKYLSDNRACLENLPGHNFPH